MEAFNALAKKLEHVHFSKTLKLNVGGQLFTTSLDTMKKDPGNEYGFFGMACKMQTLLEGSVTI